ncbi:MAG: S1C family serine protease, partial [Immundisolibacteraceae bacterium]|nr:S1C family serine protease [Immundisolibacteraceae bacterium]
MQIVKKIVLLGISLFVLGGSNTSTALAGELPDFVELADRAGPSVVNISTKQERKRHGAGRRPPQMPPGAPMDDFFRHFFGDPRGSDGPIAPARSLGSGFIVSADGYLLTN